jgi:dolichol-phosphate mannosyltransferase
LNEKLILVLPIYNESDCLQAFIEEWILLLKSLPLKFSIYAIDDGSTDDSANIIKSLQTQYPEIVLYSKSNEGHGKAVMFGYQHAAKAGADWIFQVDSDSQFLAQDFLKLWHRRAESAFILGVRENRKDTVLRKFISWFLRTLSLILFQADAKDINIPFRLMKSSWLVAMIKEVSASCLTPNVQLTLLANALHAPPLNINVFHRERQGGEASLCPKGLCKICLYALIDFVLLKFFISGKTKRLQAFLPKDSYEKD